MNDFTYVMTQLRRVFGIEKPTGILGDGVGNLYIAGKPGYLLVRQSAGTAADGTQLFGQASPVRLKPGVALSIKPGIAVVLAYDNNYKQLVIEGADPVGLDQQGISGIQENPLDRNAHGATPQTEIVTLLPFSTVLPSTTIVVNAWAPVINKTFNFFPGGAIDLATPTNFIPVAGEHAAVLISVMADFVTLEASTSTPKPTTDPIDAADFQEALTAMTDGSTPVFFYRLHDDQDAITDADKLLDERQMVNTNIVATIPVVGFTRKVTALIGDGSSTTFTVTHNLNTYDFTFAAHSTAAPRRYFTVIVEPIDLNSVTVDVALSIPPTLNEITLVIIG